MPAVLTVDTERGSCTLVLGPVKGTSEYVTKPQGVSPGAPGLWWEADSAAFLSPHPGPGWL